MKLVIDIPEEIYEEVCTNVNPYRRAYESIALKAIQKGTPLPEGHGRLIDAEDLFRFISHHAYPIRYDCNSIEQGMSITGIT